MNALINLMAAHAGVCLLIGYAFFSNGVAALPTVESMRGKTKGEIFYEWFYKFVTGLAQMIPKQPVRGQAMPAAAADGSTVLQQTTVIKTDGGGG